MKLSIKTNFADVQRKLDRMQQDIGQRALVSAVNKTMAQGQTQMIRAITSTFNLTRAKVVEKLRVRKARFSAGRFTVEAVLESESKGGRRSINVINFAARQGAQGVSVKILKAGGRKTIGAAFIGNKGRTVFQRVPGTTMQSRRGHKPGSKHAEQIKPVQAIDVQQMFNTKRVNEPVVAFIKAKFPEVFEREARYYTERFSRG